MLINKHFLNLQENYLFSQINKKLHAYTAQNPGSNIIRLGIGDVTRPLVPAVINAMHLAVEEMGQKETFHGYGEEQGYAFLRKALCDYYARKQVVLEETEVFIGDGAKSDLGNILDIFAIENTVLVPDPVYPVYVDTNIMAGRSIVYASGNRENNFLPMPESTVHADIIYLCSPNNPTGAVYTRQQLHTWVQYALAHNAVILFDSAYEIFVQDESLPTSIYQIEGAKQCAIEFGSFSKTAGFTGTRCGYTIVPHALMQENTSLNALWLRRQTTKFNGVAYVVQKAAQAVFTPEGMAQILENRNYYMQNATLIAQTLENLGIWYTGGKNSPYIWLQCPDNMPSWEFFDYLLQKVQLVGTPGAGFGANGEGFFRLTAFGDREQTRIAMQRLEKLLG